VAKRVKLNHIDLYKLRIVPLDAKTLTVMRACPEEAKRWTDPDVERTLYAFAMCQIPKSYWYHKIQTLPCGSNQFTNDVESYVEHLDEFINKQHVGLLISGSPGVGKTFLAAHIAKQAVQQNFSVWFYDNNNFTKDVMDAMRDKSVERRVDTITNKAEVLIIDNVMNGWTGKIHPLMCNKLESILEARRGRGVTIFTTLIQEATNKEENQKPMPPRLWSLVQEAMHVIKIKGVQDMRPLKAKNVFKQVVGS